MYLSNNFQKKNYLIIDFQMYNLMLFEAFPLKRKDYLKFSKAGSLVITIKLQ